MDIGSQKFAERSVSNLEVGKWQSRVFARLEEVTRESSRQGESKSRFEHGETYRIWETYIQKREHSNSWEIWKSGNATQQGGGYISCRHRIWTEETKMRVIIL